MSDVVIVRSGAGRVGAVGRGELVGAVVLADRVGAVVRLPWRCCGDSVVDGSAGLFPNRAARAANRCYLAADVVVSSVRCCRIADVVVVASV